MKKSRLPIAISAGALALSLAACGGGANPGGSPSPQSSDSPAANASALSQKVSLTGSGATFPAPLYQTWFSDLNKKDSNLQVNYAPTGSGQGIADFTAAKVDFGASDVAMKDEEIAKVKNGVILLPMTAGAIVLAYNVPGVDQLKLSRQVYVDIFLGKIKNWNDPAIAKANPGVKLPNLPITVVHRSDGSGTTAVFTQHLSAINPEWKTKVGTGKTVSWPVGNGAPKNDGVTAGINQTQGAIGYVEYGYAIQKKLKFAALENKATKFVVANDDSTSKTLAAVQLPENLRAFITDPEGADSYPIVTYTWLLINKQYPDKLKARAIEELVQYGLTEGQNIAPKLGYIALPQAVREKVATAANQIDPTYKISVTASK